MRSLILFACAIILCGFSPDQGRARVCVRGSCVNAEVVSDPASRSKGLMFRERLAPRAGMLFVFPQPGKFAFWMKNMRFPIDIIWITPDMKVGAVSENMRPCSRGECTGVSPDTESLYVLEVEAGFVKTHRITPGDRVTIR